MFKDLKPMVKNRFNYAMLLFAFLGMALSIYLWSIHVIKPDNIVCSTGGCGSTLTGEYSKILEVPVAFLGFVFYTVFAAFIFLRLFIENKVLELLINLLVGSGIIFTLYLRYLEFDKIGDICIWCWGSVVIILFIAFTLLFSNTIKAKNENSN